MIEVKNNETQAKNVMNLEVATFKKGETHAFVLRQEEEALLAEDVQKKSKINNLKLFGKVFLLSALCAASIKTYKLVDSNLTEVKEEMAMEDYYTTMSKVIAHNKYYLIQKDGKAYEDKYAYHYDKIGAYIDEASNLMESIYYQNKYVAAKDFYIASTTKYFKEHYGNIDEVIDNMKSTGDNSTLKDYVETLGYSSVDDYVDSIYQINYSFKKNNVSCKEKVKQLSLR